MLFVKGLLKRLGRKSLPKTYNSIYDLPQWNWNNIHKTDNLAYLLKLNSYHNVEENKSKELEVIWERIYDEFILEFGFSEEYKELLEYKKRIALMQLEYIQKDDRSILNMIEVEEMEFNDRFDNEEGARYETIVMAIEKRQGMSIDPRELTVYKYNNYIRTLKEEKQHE